MTRIATYFLVLVLFATIDGTSSAYAPPAAFLTLQEGRDQPPSAKDDKPDSGEKTRKPKFTIGKETTYVSGPVDKDGYIDYAAALNERLREGVTPETNANVLLWQAFGPHPEGVTPDLGTCREFAYALAARAMLRTGEGRYDDAWQDLLACHRLGRLVARGSFLLYGLVGIASDGTRTWLSWTEPNSLHSSSKTACRTCKGCRPCAIWRINSIWAIVSCSSTP
jgi:hypothetical protein